MKYTARVSFFVQKLVTRQKIAQNKALYRTAGLIRTAAKRTIRTRPNASRPGKPPHGHSNPGLRAMEFAVFGNAAIIGPIKFRGSNFFDQPVPHIHEFGGTYFSRYYLSTYPSRPYMSTALKRLQMQGKIGREFSVTMARVL